MIIIHCISAVNPFLEYLRHPQTPNRQPRAFQRAVRGLKIALDYDYELSAIGRANFSRFLSPGVPFLMPLTNISDIKMIHMGCNFFFSNFMEKRIRGFQDSRGQAQELARPPIRK